MELSQYYVTDFVDDDHRNIRVKHYAGKKDLAEPFYQFLRVDDDEDGKTSPAIFRAHELGDLCFMFHATFQMAEVTLKLDFKPTGFTSPISQEAAWENLPFADYETASIKRDCPALRSQGRFRANFWKVTIEGKQEYGFSISRINDAGMDQPNPVLSVLEMIDYFHCLFYVRNHLSVFYSSRELGFGNGPSDGQDLFDML